MRRSVGALTALAAMIANERDDKMFMPGTMIPTRNDVEHRKQKLLNKLEKQGLKPFEIDGRIVYAINRKNAERKARKHG